MRVATQQILSSNSIKVAPPQPSHKNKAELVKPAELQREAPAETSNLTRLLASCCDCV